MAVVLAVDNVVSNCDALFSITISSSVLSVSGAVVSVSVSVVVVVVVDVDTVADGIRPVLFVRVDTVGRAETFDAAPRDTTAAFASNANNAIIAEHIIPRNAGVYR